MKKTIVIGASPDPSRYSYMATTRLQAHGHEVIAVGSRKGEIGGMPIHIDNPVPGDVDTVTLYVNPIRQKEMYEYILKLKPKRIIFNPGTENGEFKALAENEGIETIEACTLVMLSTNQY